MSEAHQWHQLVTSLREAGSDLRRDGAHGGGDSTAPGPGKVSDHHRDAEPEIAGRRAVGRPNARPVDGSA